MARLCHPNCSLIGKRVIALGDRHGVSGPAIAVCAASAGATVVFVDTACFVCASAGAMDLEHQRAVLELARAGDPQSLLVMLGQADSVGVEIFARTVRQGDPGRAGALAGIALGLTVMHVFDPNFKAQIRPEVWAGEIGMLEALLETEALVEAARERSTG